MRLRRGPTWGCSWEVQHCWRESGTRSACTMVRATATMLRCTGFASGWGLACGMWADSWSGRPHRALDYHTALLLGYKARREDPMGDAVPVTPCSSPYHLVLLQAHFIRLLLPSWCWLNFDLGKWKARLLGPQLPSFAARVRLHDPAGSHTLHFPVIKQVEIKADKSPPSLSAVDER